MKIAMGEGSQIYHSANGILAEFILSGSCAVRLFPHWGYAENQEVEDLYHIYDVSLCVSWCRSGFRELWSNKDNH